MRYLPGKAACSLHINISNRCHCCGRLERGDDNHELRNIKLGGIFIIFLCTLEMFFIQDEHKKIKGTCFSFHMTIFMSNKFHFLRENRLK